jgi:hypothetical protein
MGHRSDKGRSLPPARAPERLADNSRSERHKSDRGLTIMELVVALGLFSLLLGVATPRLRADAYALWTAQQQLLADLRVTRADALTKGDHFRLDVTGPNAYLEYRLQLVGEIWVPNGEPRLTRVLPSGVTFVSGVGSQFEFNTRGLLVDVDTATTLSLAEASTSHVRDVTVWPSGQVGAL